MGLSRKPLALLATLLLLFAACGGDDGGGDASNSDNSDTTESSDSTEDAGGAEDSGDAGGSGLELTASDFQFSPTELTVEPDSEVTITVTNDGGAPHTFTAEAVGVDESFQPGQSRDVTFTAPSDGTIDFMCTIHPSMTGTIVVGGGGSDDTSSNTGGSAPDDYSY